MTLLDSLTGNTRCPREWEAEAIHDGRLTGDGRVAFERHAKSCEACARELVHLAALDRLAIAATPAKDASELHRRRLRAELLKRANGETLAHEGAQGEQRSPAPKQRFAIALGVAVAAAASIAFAARSPHPSPPIVAAPITTVSALSAPVAALPFEVEDVSAAQWTSTSSKGETRVSLKTGVASFHVEKVHTPDRFFVALPDGEIEVKGTRFVVDVQRGETRDVAVTEGVVALRLAGHGEIVLVAGEHWSKPAPTVASAPSVAAKATSTPTIASTATTTPPSAITEPRSRAGADWIAAMADYNAGRFTDCERAFEAFTRAYPTDARCEDAMFLRAVAASRRGDTSTAAADAKAYLAAYPHGLRRAQAERLAAGGE